MNAHPPKPCFALSVGVLGHRLNRLPEQQRPEILNRINEALELITGAARDALGGYQSYFAQEPAALTVISALAEGADRIGAQTALALDVALTAVLPFTVDDYEKDFVEASSRSEYRGLLGKAQKVLVLCGDRAQEARAYETAGLTILSNSDLVLGVWDNGASAGRGGTTEMLQAAARRGIPIIYIDATGAKETRVLWGGLEKFPVPGSDIADLPVLPLRDSLPEIVDRLVRPPMKGEKSAKGSATFIGVPIKSYSAKREAEKLQEFFNEPWRTRNLRLEVPLLLGLLGVRKPQRSDLWPVSPDVPSTDFARLASAKRHATADEAGESPVGVAAQAFGWADAIGVRYAQLFRGAYILNFLLVALLGLFSIVAWILTNRLAWPNVPFIVVQAVIFALILANTFAGRVKGWQERWIEAREAAERLRASVPIWLLGERPQGSPGEERTWTGWYVRANFRAMGVCPGTLDHLYLSEISEVLADLVDDQCRYHASNARRMQSVEGRLSTMGPIALATTLVASATTFLIKAIGASTLLGKWIFLELFITAGMPTVTAAIYGINVVGDFEGRAKRSARSATLLANIGKALREDPVTLANLRTRAVAIEATMLGNVAQWRLVSQLRPLEIPN